MSDALVGRWIDEHVMPPLRGRSSDAIRASLFALAARLVDDNDARRNDVVDVVLDAADADGATSFRVAAPPRDVDGDALRTALHIRMVEVCEEYQQYVGEQRARQQSVSLDFLDRELRCFRYALRRAAAAADDGAVVTLEQRLITQADDLGNTVWDGRSTPTQSLWSTDQRETKTTLSQARRFSPIDSSSSRRWCATRRCSKWAAAPAWPASWPPRSARKVSC